MSSSSDSKPPPGGWPTVRTDAGARVLVERIDQVQAELGLIGERMEGHVTHKAMIQWVGAAGVIIVAASWVVVGQASARADKAAERVEASTSAIRAEVTANKAKAEDEIAGTRKDIRDLYRFLVTKRRQPGLEADAGDQP